jgi:hypothetical protein
LDAATKALDKERERAMQQIERERQHLQAGNIFVGFHRLRGRDSIVSIAICYGLDSLGIESRWGRDFLLPFRPALGLTQPPVQWVPDLSPG